MRHFGRHLSTGAASLAIIGSAFQMSPARADDRPFAFAYTTDIETAGEKEIEQELTWPSGHAHEAFQGVGSRTEFEYRFTDDFQGSLYLNYDWSRTHDHTALGPAQTSSLPGLSGEFIYRLLNVYFGPIGLALYAEP